MNWVRIAKVAIKLIVATPALVELARAGAAAGRAIVAGIRPRDSSTGNSPPLD